MTGRALKPHCLDMQLVSAYIQYPGMTAQAFPMARHQFCVRLVALVTIKLHWGIPGHIYLWRLLDPLFTGLKELDIHCVSCYQFFSYRFSTVTEKALLSSRPQVCLAVRVTIKTCQPFHTVNLFTLMTPHTECRTRQELVKYISMTLGTGYLFHKIMLGVQPGVVYFFGVRILPVFLPMTLRTFIRRNDYLAMPRGNVLRPA